MCKAVRQGSGTGSVLGLFRILHAVEIRYIWIGATQDVLAISTSKDTPH